MKIESHLTTKGVAANYRAIDFHFVEKPSHVIGQLTERFERRMWVPLLEFDGQLQGDEVVVFRQTAHDRQPVGWAAKQPMQQQDRNRSRAHFKPREPAPIVRDAGCFVGCIRYCHAGSCAECGRSKSQHRFQ